MVITASLRCLHYGLDALAPDGLNALSAACCVDPEKLIDALWKARRIAEQIDKERALVRELEQEERELFGRGRDRNSEPLVQQQLIPFERMKRDATS